MKDGKVIDRTHRYILPDGKTLVFEIFIPDGKPTGEKQIWNRL